MYNLRGIESRTCPECGKAFDPTNSRTYRKGTGLPKFVRRLLQGLLILFVAALIALVVIEVQHQREVAAVEVLVEIEGEVKWSDDEHQWAKGIPFLHERLQHVVELRLDALDLSLIPPEVWNLTHLKKLNLNVNDLFALPPDIGRLSNLEVLFLGVNQITELPPEIGRLNKLFHLVLVSNPVTDADLDLLKPLVNLKHLALLGTGVTRQGIASLQKALPNCYIHSDFNLRFE